MKKATILTSTKFIILFGMLLILIGIAGVFATNNNQHVDVQNSSYRMVKLGDESEIGRKESFISEVPVQTMAAGEILVEKQTIINISETYIHSGHDPRIEHPRIPTQIIIPSINLEAPVVSAEFYHQQVEGDYFGSWVAPEWFAAGWHPDSALLGELGNTVINGHHNTKGMVFQKLVDVEVGDSIKVYAEDEEFSFVVSNRMILPELFVDVGTRLENARWLARSEDTRLTIVTCWPAESNTHRLILVAVPVNGD